MYKPRQFAKNVLLWIILPFFCSTILFGLIFRIFFDYTDLSNLDKQARSYEVKLHERRMDMLELRRVKIIMELDDYKESLLKTNGKPAEYGEERIVVR